MTVCTHMLLKIQGAFYLSMADLLFKKLPYNISDQAQVQLCVLLKRDSALVVVGCSMKYTKDKEGLHGLKVCVCIVCVYTWKSVLSREGELRHFRCKNNHTKEMALKKLG